jgi:hypothetical protein
MGNKKRKKSQTAFSSHIISIDILLNDYVSIIRNHNFQHKSDIVQTQGI